ncbi:MAG: FHA domain-containing protein, partial [Moraxellaceae bacterium]
MSLFYFVEILNHSGDVQARHKFSELPIRLGRGYHNDIILDDHHTAAEHAVIEQDETGKIILRDLGSQNGIKIKGRSHTHAELDGDTVAQLGHTSIRVRDSHYAVSAEMMSDSIHNRWQGWPLFVFSVLIICALSLSEAWIADITENKITDYIMGIIPWLMSAAAWTGVWALANRVFGGAANFSRHAFILSCGLLAMQLIEYIYIVLGFSFSWEAPILYKGHYAIALVAIIIYYHLR